MLVGLFDPENFSQTVRLNALCCSSEINFQHSFLGLFSMKFNTPKKASLVHIFKSKIRTPLCEQVQLSIRLSYLIRFSFPYAKNIIRKVVLNKKNTQGTGFEPLTSIFWYNYDRVGKYGSLPWGCMMSPIEYVILLTTWPLLSEDLVTDTPEYTDLEPLQVRFVTMVSV